MRVFGYNWDQGLLLHPDELFVVSKATALGCCLGNGAATWPNPLSHFLDARSAPYNPHSFNYGSLPLYLLAMVTRAAADIGRVFGPLSNWTSATGLVQATWIGRWISATFDTGSVVLTYLIARRAFDRSVAILAMAFAAFTVLSIQLSHFYAVDTMLCFFVLLTLWAAIRVYQNKRWVESVIMGAALGAGLATKTSAFPLVVPACGSALFAAGGLDLARGRFGALTPSRLVMPITRLVVSFITSIAVFAILEPYGLIDHGQLLSDVQTQNGIIVSHSIDVPYTIQFTGTQPFLYYLKNIFFWYLGPGLALAAGAGLIWVCWQVLRRRAMPSHVILLLWVLPYFVVVGKFWAKFGRYALPLLPVFSIFAAAFLITIVRHLGPKWRLAGQLATVAVLVSTALWALAFMNVYSSTNSQIAASRWLYVRLTPTTPFATDGAWDRSLPFCPPADTCPSVHDVPLNLYDTDGPAKLNRLVYALTHDRYIVMSTQRFVDSIPKVPAQYPLTSNYYRLLFNNRLNFRLVKRFTVHPALGPWTINDFPADENFTVFDHPDVRIFARTGPISPSLARALLSHPYTGGHSAPEWDGLPPANSRFVHVSRRRHGTKTRAEQQKTDPRPPVDPSNPSPDPRLILNRTQWAEDQAAPTYNQMFPPNGVGASHPVLIWLLVLEMLGLAMFPAIFFACRGLVDRGWAIAKTVSLLVATWLVFGLVGLGWARFTFSTIWTAIGLICVAGAVIGWAQRGPIAAYLRKRWREIVWTEAVFLVGFGIFIVLRMWYPDLGHQFSPVSPTNTGAGRMGEKQLELAFINAISRSQTFPPLDPFFAGGFINYYYFGYVMVSALCKATTIPTAIGFNLMIATCFGLLLSSAYSVGRTLVRSIPFALVTAAFVGLVGNLNGLIQLVQDVQTASVVTNRVPFLGGIIEFGSGLIRVLFERRLIPPFDFWASSRIVPPVGTDFAEFPFWSYLFGDLHAHVLAFPIDMAAVALSVSIMISIRRQVSGTRTQWVAVLGGNFVLAAFLLGGLEATNPLDFPTYAVVIGIGTAAGLLVPAKRWASCRSRSGRINTRITGLTPAALTVVLGGAGAAGAGLLGVALFPPLIQGYHPVFSSGLNTVLSAAGSVREALQGISRPPGTSLAQAVHDAIVTPLPIYWESFGLFLLLTVSWIVFIQLRKRGTNGGADREGIGAAIGQRLRRTESVAWIGVGIVALAFCVLDLWLLGFLVLVSGGLTHTALRSGREPRVVWVTAIMLLALGLSAFTEVFYVGDYLNGGLAFRMNTVAKVYNQIWLLLALSSGTALALMMRSFRRRRRQLTAGARKVRRLFVSAVAFTCCGSLIFTYAGTISRETYRQTWLPEDSVPWTLDGMAFMRVAYPGDYAAISWLNAHVRGTPVVIEADQAYYNWRSRVEQFTGLPSLLGGIYEGAQRYPDEVAPRQAALEEIYGATSRNTSAATFQQFHISRCPRLSLPMCVSHDLLQEYDVSYVYVGLMERQLWPQGVGKFALMPGVARVFHAGGTSIYHVAGSPA